MRVLLAAMALVAGVCAAPARAARSAWTGSAGGGTGHPRQPAAWQKTRHATTAARLPARPAARCLACHGTGEAPAGPAIAVEVGCEACHGAGAAYAAADLMQDRPVALALGLTDVATPRARAAVCAACHRAQTRSAAFDPTAPVHPVSGS